MSHAALTHAPTDLQPGWQTLYGYAMHDSVLADLCADEFEWCMAEGLDVVRVTRGAATDLHVRSPISGRIAKRRLAPGESWETALRDVQRVLGQEESRIVRVPCADGGMRFHLLGGEKTVIARRGLDGRWVLSALLPQPCLLGIIAGDMPLARLLPALDTLLGLPASVVRAMEPLAMDADWASTIDEACRGQIDEALPKLFSNGGADLAQILRLGVCALIASDEARRLAWRLPYIAKLADNGQRSRLGQMRSQFDRRWDQGQPVAAKFSPARTPRRILQSVLPALVTVELCEGWAAPVPQADLSAVGILGRALEGRPDLFDMLLAEFREAGLDPDSLVRAMLPPKPADVPLVRRRIQATDGCFH